MTKQEVSARRERSLRRAEEPPFDVFRLLHIVFWDGCRREWHSRLQLYAARATRTHPTSGPSTRQLCLRHQPLRAEHLLQVQEAYCRVKLATATGLVEYPLTTAIARTVADPVIVKGPRYIGEDSNGMEPSTVT